MAAKADSWDPLLLPSLLVSCDYVRQVLGCFDPSALIDKSLELRCAIGTVGRSTSLRLADIQVEGLRYVAISCGPLSVYPYSGHAKIAICDGIQANTSNIQAGTMALTILEEPA